MTTMSSESSPPRYSACVCRLLPLHNVRSFVCQRLSSKKFITRAFHGPGSLWRALPCAIAALLWATQMIYFYVYFVTLPSKPDGSWPRIGSTYAMFPFISCIGAVRQTAFQAVSISMAILLWLGFGIDCVVGSCSGVGVWWRRGKLVMASTSNVFLIALTFANFNDERTRHLIFTSLQIGCMGLCKTCDWRLTRAMRLRTPENPYLERSWYWKRIIMVVASPCSIVAIIGIYGCTARIESGRVVFTSTCWTVVSAAAPAEWTLSWCWVIFLCTISYDSYHLDYTVESLLEALPPTNTRTCSMTFWQRWARRVHLVLGGQKRDQTERQLVVTVEKGTMVDVEDAAVFEESETGSSAS